MVLIERGSATSRSVSHALLFVSAATLLAHIASARKEHHLPNGEHVDRREDSSARTHSAVPLIQGGLDAVEGRFPSAVSLRGSTEKHTCGGILVDASWVLTAAHCVDPNLTRSVGMNPIVAIGPLRIDDNSTKPGVEETVGEAVIHERWNGNVWSGFDIALIKLRKPSDKVPPPIAAQGSEIGQGQFLLAIGWGDKGPGSPPPVILQQATFEFVPQENCNMSGGWDGKIMNSMMCAQSRFANTCKGDSGGPLLIAHAPQGEVDAGDPSKDVVVGIVSYGDGACIDESIAAKPAVFTRVSEFRDWIEKITGKAPKPPPPMIDPRATQEEKDMALLQFSEEGNLAGVKEALNLNACLSFADEFGYTPLHYVAMAGNQSTDIAKLLVEKDAPLLAMATKQFGDENGTVPWTGVGASPLLVAAAHNNSGVAQVLLEAGVEVDLVTTDQLTTPLHVASYFGNAEVAEVLLENGANIEAHDKFQETPLNKAAGAGHANIVKLFISHGVDLEAHDLNEETSLIKAAKKGHLDVVQILVENGAAINAKAHRGDTALVRAALLHGNEAVVKVLVEAGADVDMKDRFGETPLYKAAFENNVSIMKVLIKGGADLDATNLTGVTPLLVAAKWGSLEPVKVLVMNGADVNAADKFGWTSLMRASRWGEVEMVEFLLEQGADKDPIDHMGRTAKDWVCRSFCKSEEDRILLKSLL